ncbi:MAG: LPS assembly lipoprotein LptE [Alphaproteobacteria bacterium]
MMRFLIIPLIVLLSSLSACGFSPVYGTHANSAPVVDEMNQVAIENIPDRRGQVLRNHLIDRMYSKGRPRSTLYRLETRLRFTIEDLGIQSDATSTRALMNMYADYVLIDRNGKILFKGTAHSVSSYNKLANQYASLAASEDAEIRTVKEVSEQIINSLSLYFAERASPNRTSIQTEKTPK